MKSAKSASFIFIQTVINKGGQHLIAFFIKAIDLTCKVSLGLGRAAARQYIICAHIQNLTKGNKIINSNRLVSSFQI